MPDKFRPDRCGIVLSYRDEYKGMPIIVANQAWNGVYQSNKKAVELLASLSDQGVILVIEYELRDAFIRFPTNVDCLNREDAAAIAHQLAEHRRTVLAAQ